MYLFDSIYILDKEKIFSNFLSITHRSFELAKHKAK